jgi:mono/diheme cytochrome c family protein
MNMINVTYGPARWIAAGASMLSAALILPGAAAAADAAKPPTFTRDVAPIFQEKCEACHRPDSMAPMSLQTFAEARPWARSIKARVTDRQMPPWQIDRSVGIQKFKNDRSLTDEQIDLITRWVDAGRTCLPPSNGPTVRAGISRRRSARKSRT